MSSSVDYTPVLLAQLTDLQMRVTKQDATIAALKTEVERLSGKTITVNDSLSSTMRTSVPLRPKPGSSYPQRDGQRDGPRDSYSRDNRPHGVATQRDGHMRQHHDSTHRTRPKVATTKSDDAPRPTMSLSDVLENGEKVTIQVGTGKDSEGKFTHTTASATFDGTDLVVNECQLVESLVGMKSSKPGEILYKFIDELKSAGHIKRTFTIAPWKLCFVERDGVKKTLEELRSTIG